MGSTIERTASSETLSSDDEEGEVKVIEQSTTQQPTDAKQPARIAWMAGAPTLVQAEDSFSRGPSIQSFSELVPVANKSIIESKLRPQDAAPQVAATTQKIPKDADKIERDFIAATSVKFEKPIQAGKNETKNRYADIYSYQSTQIMLANEKYINASLIGMDNLQSVLAGQGVAKNVLEKINWAQIQSRNYIATQGPLQATIDDFWKMVEEYRATDVVMLTKLEEGRLKCAQYWQEESEQYEQKKESKQVGNPNNSNQTVTHHWFQAWPDHGVPKTTQPFLDLVREVANKTKSPLVVHCSAGAGRTGTFILVDMMQRIISAATSSLLTADEKLLLAAGVFKYLRSCRTQMIQTLDQWKFALQALDIVETNV